MKAESKSDINIGEKKFSYKEKEFTSAISSSPQPPEKVKKQIKNNKMNNYIAWAVASGACASISTSLVDRKFLTLNKTFTSWGIQQLLVGLTRRHLFPCVPLCVMV